MNQKLLKEIVDYDPLTGAMTWKTRPLRHFKNLRAQQTFNGRYAGRAVGSDSEGYLQTSILGERLQVHQLAWLYVHGYIPAEMDHINGKRSDNRIENLRDVPRLVNHKNMKLSAANTSGATGVYFHKKANKWAAGIKVNYKDIHLGLFVEFGDAVKARKDAERQYGFHENHGRARP